MHNESSDEPTENRELSSSCALPSAFIMGPSISWSVLYFFLVLFENTKHLEAKPAGKVFPRYSKKVLILEVFFSCKSETWNTSIKAERKSFICGHILPLLSCQAPEAVQNELSCFRLSVRAPHRDILWHQYVLAAWQMILSLACLCSINTSGEAGIYFLQGSKTQAVKNSNTEG